ncbi:MAG: hypothetical protein ACYS8Z_06895 [Planctomycetota bacterium]
MAVILACCTFISGCREKEPQPAPARESPALAGKAELPIIAIYVESGHRSPRTSVAMILAVWANGEAIWSKSWLGGGPPYFSGKIPSGKIEAFFEKLSDNRIFKDRIRNYSVSGLDVGCTTIYISRGKERVNMQSWHEQGESAGAVVTAESMIFQGASEDDSLAAQPRWYRRFRDMWATIRQAADELVPVDGEVVPDAHFKTVELRKTRKQQS